MTHNPSLGKPTAGWVGGELLPEYEAIRDALHFHFYDLRHGCGGTHLFGMGDCQYAARAVWDRLHPDQDQHGAKR